MTTEKVELKACPFCGGHAHLITEPPTDQFDYVLIRPQCKVCGGGLGGYLKRSEAITAWNTRAAGEAVQGVGASQLCDEPSSDASVSAPPTADVPRDEQGRSALDIIADRNKEALRIRAGVPDRSREPLLGPPDDMAVSRILLGRCPGITPREADEAAVEIVDLLRSAAGQSLDGRARDGSPHSQNDTSALSGEGR